MSNVDYKNKYLKLKDLVAKSLLTIDRMSELSGGGSLQTSSQEFGSKIEELKTKLSNYNNSLRVKMDSTKTTFDEDVETSVSNVVDILEKTADSTVQLIENLNKKSAEVVNSVSKEFSESVAKKLERVTTELNELNSVLNTSVPTANVAAVGGSKYTTLQFGGGDKDCGDNRGDCDDGRAGCGDHPEPSATGGSDGDNRGDCDEGRGGCDDYSHHPEPSATGGSDEGDGEGKEHCDEDDYRCHHGLPPTGGFRTPNPNTNLPNLAQEEDQEQEVQSSSQLDATIVPMNEALMPQDTNEHHNREHHHKRIEHLTAQIDNLRRRVLELEELNTKLTAENETLSARVSGSENVVDEAVVGAEEVVSNVAEEVGDFFSTPVQEAIGGKVSSLQFYN